MIKVTKHTSNICGCITWFEWDSESDEGSRVHTDIAFSPCPDHDPVNSGNTVIHESVEEDSLQAVQRTSTLPTKFVSELRPGQIKDIIPLSGTVAPRKEMYLQEETRGVLLQVPEISEDQIDENSKIVGRKFKDAVDVNFQFNEDRKLVVDLKGVDSLGKQIAVVAISQSSLEIGNIIIA